MYIVAVILALILISCDTKVEEKAKTSGRLVSYLHKVETGDMEDRIKEKYPNLQIGLIYYDIEEKRYKAVDPRKGLERLGYYPSFNKEFYYYLMYKLTKEKLKEKHDLVEKKLIETLEKYQRYMEEAKKTERKKREMIELVIKYGGIGIILFSLIVGVSIAYLLFSIARKHL
ncbi:MAG: hypothetical protein GXO45_05660 [Aquificae bacterium]|nr:hypothetical protein [Aquificota bacterium]